MWYKLIFWQVSFTYHSGGVLKDTFSQNKILFTEHLPFKTPPGWYEPDYYLKQNVLLIKSKRVFLLALVIGMISNNPFSAALPVEWYTWWYFFFSMLSETVRKMIGKNKKNIIQIIILIFFHNDYEISITGIFLESSKTLRLNKWFKSLFRT